LLRVIGSTNTAVQGATKTMARKKKPEEAELKKAGGKKMPAVKEEMMDKGPSKKAMPFGGGKKMTKKKGAKKK
jgi:hypothetical protein